MLYNGALTLFMVQFNGAIVLSVHFLHLKVSKVMFLFIICFFNVVNIELEYHLVILFIKVFKKKKQYCTYYTHFKSSLQLFCVFLVTQLVYF